MSQSNIIHLSPQDYAQLPNPPQLIDVRTGLEYDRFRAPQAIHVGLTQIMLGQLPLLRRWLLPDWLRSRPKDKAIAVICLTSHRSPIAAQQLAQNGFQQVINITGGMMAWQKTGLPVQTGSTSRKS